MLDKILNIFRKKSEPFILEIGGETPEPTEEDNADNDDLEPRELRENESYLTEDYPELGIGQTQWFHGMEENSAYTKINDGRVRVTNFPKKR